MGELVTCVMDKKSVSLEVGLQAKWVNRNNQLNVINKRLKYKASGQTVQVVNG